MSDLQTMQSPPMGTFDKDGNYTLGLRDQTIFPELKADAVEKPRGMNITFVMRNAVDREASLELLTQLGMPFQRQN